MKILVIGGTGLIGSKTVEQLRLRGYKVIAASPSSGVDTLTGQGLDAAMAGVDVVIDVTNSPSFDDQAVRDFFERSGRHLSAAERQAGVKHHLALSVVGTDRLAASGYFRGKMVQEKWIRDAGIPYTIVRSTQFFEFLMGIVEASADGEDIRLSSALMQPIGSDDVALALADVALATPINDVVEIAGPDAFPLSDLARQFLAAIGDSRKVVADAEAPYFGAVLQQETLLPGPHARLGSLTFPQWVRQAGLAHNGAVR
jgi:uncharacterized protein YbjT (DUF2867 family)